MIAATTGAAAVDGGLEVLKRGGSAVDAALATSLAQIALAAGSWVSYAGIMTMVCFDAASGRTYNMNAAFNSVKAERDPLLMPGYEFADLKGNPLRAAPAYQPSGRTALVPGFMAGVDA